MKKYWLIAAFAVCVVSHGFAQNLSLSFTGGVFLDDDGIAPAEEGEPGKHAAELGLAFDAEKAGFYGTVELANDQVVDSSVRDYAGWISLFDTVTVYGGKMLYEEYVLTDVFDDNDFNTPIADGEFGMVFTLTAIDGYSASIFLPAPGLAGTDEDGEEETVPLAWDDVRPAAGLSGPLGQSGTFYVSYRSDTGEVAVLAEIDVISDTLILAGYTGVFDGDDHDTLHRADLGVSRLLSGFVDAAFAFRGEKRDGEFFGYGKIGCTFLWEPVMPSLYISVQGTTDGGHEETGFGGALEVAPAESAVFSVGLEFVYADKLEWGVPVLLSIEL